MLEGLPLRRDRLSLSYHLGLKMVSIAQSAWAIGEVYLESLLATREEMIEKIVEEMPQPHREFLVSFKASESDCSLLAVPEIKELPAIKFRQIKLAALDPKVCAQQFEKLKRVVLNRDDAPDKAGDGE